MTWPPDYTLEFLNRQERLNNIRAKGMGQHAKAYYSQNPIDFIEHWCVTYDPRNAGKGIPALMPFILFPKQKELVLWLIDRIYKKENGLIEKSRDMGATWVCVALTVWLWLFKDGSSVGWGSRKEMLVDRIGDPDSIFEKIRMTLKYLPDFLLPSHINDAKSSYLKINNPDTLSNITGESGNNIGRGGRKLVYFKDESAHYDQAELIEASLADNTNTQIDISSVNGSGNVFFRKRHGGGVNVFVMDWSDHPAKDQKWYDTRKRDAELNGLDHIFAQEVDRDYGASSEGILIKSKYIKAAIDAHIKLGFEPFGDKVVGLDVADEGGDKNAMCYTFGPVVLSLDEWGEGDTSKTTIRAYNYTLSVNADSLVYDSIGVGAGVKGKIRELLVDKEEGQHTFNTTGFNAGSGVYKPESTYALGKKNKDMFANIKAQAWWGLRERFHKTYLAVTEGRVFPHSELISLSSNMPMLHKLTNELSSPLRDTDNVGRIKIESKKEMKRRGVQSPNLADALVMCYQPKRATNIRSML